MIRCNSFLLILIYNLTSFWSENIRVRILNERFKVLTHKVLVSTIFVFYLWDFKMLCVKIEIFK